MATPEQIPDLQRQNSLLGRLLEVSLILNSNLALSPLLEFIMTATCEITDAEAASIMLYDRKTDELRFVASSTPGTDIESMAKIPVPMEGSIAGQIVRENRPIIVQDAEGSGVYRRVGDKLGYRTRSLLGVPMQIKGAVVGVLEAVNKRQETWTEDDPHYLSILAAQAAVAIQNAQQAEALQKAYDSLHELDKLKSDFIAIASHELRTPLAVILGYASFLKEDAQGEASEYATNVLNSALHLRDLIEDMVNLRYLKIGRTEINRDDVPVPDLLDAARHEVQAMIDAKGHQLEILCDDCDAVVHVDRLKMGTALTNILNNAIKYTPDKGKITLIAEQRPHEVWMKIIDTGIGLQPDQVDKVFDEFYQAEDHMTRRYNGMGIGLAISRAIVLAHDGRIWAESEGPNKGSTFIIALPLSESAGAAQPS